MLLTAALTAFALSVGETSALRTAAFDMTGGASDSTEVPMDSTSAPPGPVARPRPVATAPT